MCDYNGYDENMCKAMSVVFSYLPNIDYLHNGSKTNIIKIEIDGVVFRQQYISKRETQNRAFGEALIEIGKTIIDYSKVVR